MWTRKQLKSDAKTVFKANYWPCVIAALIMIIFTGAASGYSANYYRNRVAGVNSAAENKANQEISQLLEQTFESKEISINGKVIEFNDDFTAAKLSEAAEEISAALEGGSLNINGNDIDLSDPADVEYLTAFTTKLNKVMSSLENYSDSDIATMVASVIAGMAGVLALYSIILALIKLLVFNPLRMGCFNFFMKNSRVKAELGEIGRGFSPNYGRNVGALFLTDLFICLWSMLFIIPGIIKTYSYRMVPYILADNPDMGATEAITLSRKIMNGNKWKSFVLDLSFIGWYLLTGLTFGILGVFYVYPYVYSTDAQLYEAIK